MLYRRFGRTELSMPVFSCGGMRYQFKWQDVPLNEVPKDNQDNLKATIQRALELGINHIETARGYGSSERQLGLILPKFPREELIIQTKVAPDQDSNKFRSNFMESLERLQVERVDLMALHGVNNAKVLEWSIRPGGCLEVARKLQKEGYVDHVGFSTHGPLDVLMEGIQCEDYGGFDYINLHWYYIFQWNWPAVLAARKRDMGIFIISPSDKGGKLYAPPEKLVKLCQPLHPMVFNDLFCLSHPEIHTLSIGAARPSDFDCHMETLELLDRHAELLPPIIERLEKAMEEAVGKEFANSWQVGLPRWEETPGEINIPIIVWLRNLSLAYDMVDYGKMRYNLLGQGDHWFPGYHAGGLEEVDIEPALQKSPFKKQITGILNEAHAMLYAEPKKRLSESEG